MTAEQKIKIFANEFEVMPGITIIHEIDGFKPLFMTSNGLKLLGLSLEELVELKEKYQELFFNQIFMADYLEQLKILLEENTPEETYTIFHEVKIGNDVHWYASSIKVFQTDLHQHPTHTITYAVPLEDYQWTVKRAERLQHEVEFARKNLKKFSKLTSREKQVLALAAGGKRTAQIADQLDVSTETVNSHLKSIKNKLRATTSFQLNEFARAFDLL